MKLSDAIAVLERRAVDAAFHTGSLDLELEKAIRAIVAHANRFGRVSAICDTVSAELIAAGWRYDVEGSGSFLPDDEIVPALREALAQRAKAIAITDAMVSRCLECDDDREAHVEDDGISCTTCGGDFVVCVDGRESLEALDRWREYVKDCHREHVDALKGRLADVEETLHTAMWARDKALAAERIAVEERKRANERADLAVRVLASVSDEPPRSWWPWRRR